VGKLSIGGTYTYTSSQYATRADDVITLANGTTVPTTTVFGFNPGLLPATNLFNINVNWNNVMGSPVDAAFFMTNVTNDIYPVNVGSGLGSAGFENFIYGAPRMWGFRLRYKFGQ
jgi:iron complex outermembrane recepter protein